MTFRRRTLNKELFKSFTQIYNQTQKIHAWFAAYDLLILRLQGLNHLIATKFLACSNVSEKVNSLLTVGMKVGIQPTEFIWLENEKFR